MKPLKAALASLLLLFLLSPRAMADEFIKGVYPATPPTSFTLYAFDPELLGAWDTTLYDYEKKYIPEKYQSLPVLGGWYGQGFVPDREMVMASGLKKAFLVRSSFFNTDRIRDTLAEMGLELLTAPDGVYELPECFRTMGRIFNRQARGEELAAYAEKVLASVKKLNELPKGKRFRVYLAMDADGLATSCAMEARSYFIEVGGGTNVMVCNDSLQPGRPRISFEDILVMDPDVILAESYELKKIMDAEPRWQGLRAAKEGRIYYLPRGPFSWNGHPTLTALMGVQWLANVLYPDLYPLDLPATVKEFNKLFFRLDLNDQTVKELIDPGSVN
ncbi:MAG: ABC transporter substrate-binding protein [Deltaproteobacteria bacterium]|jgi:iron complex transport system substrate-binding protein|nr:ABC transporter substrate-binding protein [Deltaproteobacteria bacterium]